MSVDHSPYATFQGFLRSAITQYWERRGASRVTFLALLFATREAWGVALDKTLDIETGRKALRGAAGVAAITVLLRIFLGGPIGVLLTGASLVSLVAAYAKNHDRVWAKQERIRELVGGCRTEHERVLSEFRAGQFAEHERDLMIDGLMSRFLLALDDGPEDKRERGKPAAPAGPKADSFAAHVAEKRKG
ncbi:MAG: hypothetical protein H6726_07015 [Sandaracinaceae bacterium]|nr:hypothetical protein [Myxococcales bacterium]MCB9657389.1 hypothetical protein [Sandaracinaceae bacterium]